MNSGLHAFVDEALKYPEANEEAREGPNLKAVKGSSFQLTPNESLQPLDLETMRSELVNEPIGSRSKEEYTFRMVSYTALKEKVTFTINGNETILNLGPHIRTKADVRKLIPRPATTPQRLTQAIVRWFNAPFF